MIDMAKVHGIELAKQAVMEAWHNASEELTALTDRISELTAEYVRIPNDKTVALINKHIELDNVNKNWAVSYGMVEMCSQLCDRFEDMIDAEYKSEAV